MQTVWGDGTIGTTPIAEHDGPQVQCKDGIPYYTSGVICFSGPIRKGLRMSCILVKRFVALCTVRPAWDQVHWSIPPLPYGSYHVSLTPDDVHLSRCTFGAKKIRSDASPDKTSAIQRSEPFGPYRFAHLRCKKEEKWNGL